MRGRRALAAALLAASVADSSAAAGFVATAQDRSVSVDITQSTLECWPPPTGCSVVSSSTQSDAHSAPDFGSFSATAMVTGFADSFASQDSSLGAVAITAHGTLAAASSGGLVMSPDIFGTSESSLSNTFSTSFDVDVATPYRLTGSVAASGGLSANTTARIELSTAGGAVIAQAVAASDPECQDSACAQVGPIPVSSFGTLAPGSYVLEATATGGASPFYFGGSFYGLGSSGSFDLALDAIAAPALSRAGQATLAACLALLSAAALAPGRRARG